METDNNKKYVIWGVIAVVVIVAVVWQANRSGFNLKGISDPATTGNTVGQTQNQPQSQNIFGTVESVNGQTIALKVASPGAGGKVSSSEKSITTDSSTVFEKIVLKDQATLQKEFADYSAKSKTDKSAVPPPPFDRVKISLSDIKKGDSVMAVVTSAGKVTNVLVQPPAAAPVR